MRKENVLLTIFAQFKQSLKDVILGDVNLSSPAFSNSLSKPR